MFRTKRLQIIFSLVSAAGLWAFLMLVNRFAGAGTGLERVAELLGGTSQGYIQIMIYGGILLQLFRAGRKAQRIIKAAQGISIGSLA